MIAFNKNIRSAQDEIMDSLDFGGVEMRNLLDDLKTVNKWLGGNSITLDGLEKLLKDHPKSKEVVLVDIGCGDGELLRRCSDFASKNGYNLKGIGIDINPHILEHAKFQSADYPFLEYRKIDVLLDQNSIPNSDIAMFTLFLHHFNNDQIENILKSIIPKTSKGLIINDLQRSKSAFVLFKFISLLFLRTKTARHDGLVSIARGFRKHELEYISKKIPNQKSTICWKWAFRYQWIIEKKRMDLYRENQ